MTADAKQISTTLGELAESEAALLKVLSIKFDQPGGARVRYHVVKLSKLVSLETKHFYEERNALVTKHGDGEPKRIMPTSDKWSVFSSELKELAAIPVTIAWGPVTDAMIEAYPEITGADLIGLGPLYEQGE